MRKRIPPAVAVTLVFFASVVGSAAARPAGRAVLSTRTGRAAIAAEQHWERLPFRVEHCEPMWAHPAQVLCRISYGPLTYYGAGVDGPASKISVSSQTAVLIARRLRGGAIGVRYSCHPGYAPCVSPIQWWRWRPGR